MRFRPRLCAAVTTAVVLMCASLASAQVKTTGIIEGTVTDETGAVLPGVSMTLTHVDTGIHFEAVTDHRGVYRFLAVPIRDHYQLKAELQGFSTALIEGIVVDSAVTQAFAIQLKVGVVGEVLTVTAEAPLVDTKNSITREVIDEKLANAVPLVTRHFTEVASLFAGIQYNPVDSTPANTQFHVRGQPTVGHGYAQDGANLNSPYLGRNGMYLSQNAIERFEFLPGGFQAEYGEQAGGYINIITKSGGNTVKGAYSFVYKPEELGSVIRSGIPGQIKDKTPTSALFHEVALGGPLKKDRAWYFAALQYRNDNVGNILAQPVRESTWYNNHLKLTYFQNPENQWNLILDVDPLWQNNTTLTSTVTPEAQREQNVTNWLAHLKQSHIFNSSTVFESQAYILHLAQAAPPHQQTGNPNVTLVTPGGTTEIGQAGTRTGWVEDKLRGSVKITTSTIAHTLKTGFDYTVVWGRRESTQLVPIFTDRRPVGGTLTRTDNNFAVLPSIDNRQFAVYVQDTWTPTSQLTFDAGVRVDWERVVGKAHGAPRFGFSYALPGRKPSKIYGNWGLFYQYVPGTTYTFDKFLIDQRLYLVRNPVGLVGEDVLQNVFRNVLLPISQPYTVSWSVGYERALPYDIRAGMGFAQNNILHQPVSVRYPNRVEQGSIGRIFYRGVELTFRKLFVGRYELVGAYTYSKNVGDTPSTLTEQQVPYRRARMDWDSPHAANITGRAELVYGIEVAGVYRFSTGRPYSLDNAQVGTLVAYVDRDGNPAGRNIYRMKDYSSLDTTISRRQRVGRFDTNLFLQIFNVPNRVNVLAVRTTQFGGGAPTRVDNGRQFQFGFDLKF
jgi:hypothetical protein